MYLKVLKCECPILSASYHLTLAKKRHMDPSQTAFRSTHEKKINEGVATLRIYRNNNWNRHRVLCPDFIRFFQEVGFLFPTLCWTTRPRDSFRLSLLTVKSATVTTTRRCSSRRMPWKNWEHTCPSLSWDFIAVNKKDVQSTWLPLLTALVKL